MSKIWVRLRQMNYYDFERSLYFVLIDDISIFSTNDLLLCGVHKKSLNLKCKGGERRKKMYNSCKKMCVDRSTDLIFSLEFISNVINRFHNLALFHYDNCWHRRCQPLHEVICKVRSLATQPLSLSALNQCHNEMINEKCLVFFCASSLEKFRVANLMVGYQV